MLLVLDAYHLGDPLFVTGLALDLAARGQGAVLVHGSAERGERALESLGAFPEAVEGVWTVDDEEQAAAVERATRDLNREIAHELNEAGVASIRVIGADRGLLKAGADGVQAGRAGWLQSLVEQGVVAVVAALVGGDGGALREVDAAAAAAALAERLRQPVTVLLRGRPGDGPVSVSRAAGSLADADAAGRLLARGGDARAAGRAELRSGGQVIGKRLVA